MPLGTKAPWDESPWDEYPLGWMPLGRNPLGWKPLGRKPRLPKKYQGVGTSFFTGVRTLTAHEANTSCAMNRQGAELLIPHVKVNVDQSFRSCGPGQWNLLPPRNKLCQAESTCFQVSSKHSPFQLSLMVVFTCAYEFVLNCWAQYKWLALLLLLLLLLLLNVSQSTFTKLSRDTMTKVSRDTFTRNWNSLLKGDEGYSPIDKIRSTHLQAHFDSVIEVDVSSEVNAWRALGRHLNLDVEWWR